MERLSINNWLVTVDGDVVKFYDRRYDDQFVSSYYTQGIIEYGGRELQLDSGIPAWTVRDYEMVAVVGWLKSITK